MAFYSNISRLCLGYKTFNQKVCLCRSQFISSKANSYMKKWEFLYTSGSKATSGSPVQPDLLDFLSEDKYETILSGLRLRGYEFDMHQLKLAVKQYKALTVKREEIERKREEIADAIALFTQSKGKDEKQDFPKDLALKGKSAKVQLKSLMSEYYGAEQLAVQQVLSLPCALHTRSGPSRQLLLSTKSDSDATRVNPLSREEIGLVRSTVSSGSLYALAPLAHCVRHVTNAGALCLRARGWAQWTPPEFVKPVVMEGCGYDVEDSAKHFRLALRSDESRAQQLFVPGGAHLAAFAAYFTRHVLHADDLPVRWFTLSSSYGSRQEEGLLQQHKNNPLSCLLNCSQQRKVMAFALVRDASEANLVQDEMQECMQHFYTELRLSINLWLAAAPDLHRNESLRIDCVAASDDSQQALGHIAQHASYVSSRLMIKASDNVKDVLSRHYPHMVSCCLVNVLPTLAMMTHQLSSVEKLEHLVTRLEDANFEKT